MNLFAIGSHPHKHGFLGWYRRVHRAVNEILKDGDGHEIIFPSKAEAEAAAGRALAAYCNSPIVNWTNNVRDERKAQAERALFKAREAAE